MELLFDLWHLAFVNLIQGRAPPSFEVQSEVRLNIEPQRADLLLLRRIGAAQQDQEARVLRALWAWLGRVTILEIQEPGRLRVPSRRSAAPGGLRRAVRHGAPRRAPGT